MEYTMVEASDPANFEKAIRPETRLIYIETPSNPRSRSPILKQLRTLQKNSGIITIIDNTFASPVNQNPLNFGIDIVTHSGTKYIGGPQRHLLWGSLLRQKNCFKTSGTGAIHFGGSLDAHTCWLVERSLKTIVLRVRQQNHNAMSIASFLQQDSRIGRVFYPGLPEHPGHSIAKAQMSGGLAECCHSK
jgi:cystathionine beta-lyase